MFRSLNRPGYWIAGSFGSLSLVTAFALGQGTPPTGFGPQAANTVIFAPGNSIPLRGVPLANRPINNSIALNTGSGTIYFGGFPAPVQNMPSTPLVARGF